MIKELSEFIKLIKEEDSLGKIVFHQRIDLDLLFKEIFLDLDKYCQDSKDEYITQYEILERQPYTKTEYLEYYYKNKIDDKIILTMINNLSE
jgi:hypothetical protein